MARRKVTIEILGDDSQLKGTLKGTSQSLGAFGVAGGVALAGLASKALQFGQDSVAAYAESEASQAKLADAFARFPALADTNVKSIQELGAALATKTRFDDDATAAAAASLAQYGLTGKQVESLIPLVADYAAKTGVDLATASEQVGKAMLGQGRALKGVGVDFKDAGSVGANFEQVMTGLRTQVGGFAEKEGTTGAGKAEILKNRFGELQEAVGAKLIPALSTFADWLIKVGDWIQKNSAWIGPLVAALGTVAGIFLAIAAATRVWAAAQAALNAVMAMNPIGLVVIAIAGLVAAIVWAWKNSETFRTVVRAVWAGIKAAFTAGVEFVKRVLSAGWAVLKRIFSFTPLGIITQNFDKIVGFFKGLPAKFTSALSTVKDIVFAPFKAAFNAIARAWNSTVGKISLHAPSWVPGLGGKGFDVPDIPTLAHGGVIRARPGGTLVLAGEGRNDEAVVPLRRGAAGLGTTVNVYLPVAPYLADQRTVSAWVVDALRTAAARGYTPALA